jgi:hypothetical protein
MHATIALSADERKALLDLYRHPCDPAVGRRAHILLLLGEGYPWDTIAAVLFTSASTPQDPPAHAVDHRSVAAHQGLEDRRAAPGEVLLDELPVGLPAQRCGRRIARRLPRPRSTPSSMRRCSNWICSSSR